MDEIFKSLGLNYTVLNHITDYGTISTNNWTYDITPVYTTGNGIFNTWYTQPLVTLNNSGTSLTVNGEKVAVESDIATLKAEIEALKKKLGYE